MKLLLGTNNPGKLREMGAILGGMGVQLVSPADLGLLVNVDETGSTYQENAAIKAQAFAAASGLLSLADDSGLEVEILGGAPGLHSARYSPLKGATDADRRRLLLERLDGKPRPWKARFRCLVALADPAGKLYHTEGVCLGEIIPEERGQGGFGYDPIFFIQELGKTMAELPPEVKNRISHRGQAVRAARPLILSMLQGENE
jgi:XTP/dITP diphosphohydrolase